MRTRGRAWFVRSFAILSLAGCGKVETNVIDGPSPIDAAETTIDAPDTQSFTVMVTLAGTGTGGVTSLPAGIDCGTTCVATFPSGQQVMLTAAPTGGSVFMGWSGACTGTATTCTFTVTAAATATATFNPRPNAYPDSITLQCTDGATIVTCPAGLAGQDGHYTLNVPTYTAATGSVTDSVTGLVWERTHPTGYQAWSAADTRCANLVLDGQSDWRLPTLLELVSLLDVGRIGPPWPTAMFGTIPQNSFFWSSTAPAGGGGHLGINTNYPVAYIRADAGSAEFSRCVRGTAFTGTLTAAGGSIVDSRTGLAWSSGTSASSTWSAALASCENLTLDGSSAWRLPNVKELLSIVDSTRSAPAISTLFSARPATTFWSSTPAFATSSYVVDFNSGASFNIETQHATTHAVRCVR